MRNDAEHSERERESEVVSSAASADVRDAESLLRAEARNWQGN